MGAQARGPRATPQGDASGDRLLVARDQAAVGRSHFDNRAAHVERTRLGGGAGQVAVGERHEQSLVGNALNPVDLEWRFRLAPRDSRDLEMRRSRDAPELRSSRRSLSRCCR